MFSDLMSRRVAWAANVLIAVCRVENTVLWVAVYWAETVGAVAGGWVAGRIA